MSEHFLYPRLARIVTRLSAVFALVLLILPISIYLWFVHSTLDRLMAGTTFHQGRVVEEFIQRQPDHWRDNADRLQAMVEPLVLPGQHLRLSDRDGATVFEVGAADWTYQHFGRPVHEFGQPAGWLAVGLSQRANLGWGLLVLGLSAIAAWLVWIPFRRMPLDALLQAETALRAHQEHLEDLVTERTADLVQAKEAAEAASRAKSLFLSSMSHELRTPMNAVLGFAQIMECDGDLSAEHRESLYQILKAGNHLLDLITDVLNLSRIESGRLELSPERIELAGLGEECRRLMQPAAEEARIALHIDLSATTTVFADRLRLKQALLNLLSNAVKYNRPEGQVYLAATAGSSGCLRVTVRDTGPGIAPERLGDLFQPFNRLGMEAGTIPGTGIGLNITRRLVEAMNGTIGVDSTPGSGSTFWIEMPVEGGAAGASRIPRVLPVGA